MPVTATDDTTTWDSIWARVSKLDGAEVEAGLHDPEQATKGVIHELGAPRANIPARPWMSIAADTGQAQILSDAGKAVAAVADGAQPRAALELLGQTVVNLEVSVITEGRVGGPALAPATIEAKGSSRKLVDTSAMLQALSVEVKL